MIIITNNKPRMLLTWAELPSASSSEFYYVDDADRHEPRFFKYRGDWYDVIEFDYVSDRPCYAPLRGTWTEVQPDSFFSGIVFRWFDEFNSVIVGRYYA
jgi:hypothetical protein